MDMNWPEHITINDLNINLKNSDWNDLKQIENSASWWVSIIDFLEELAREQDYVTLQTSGSTGEAKVMKVEKYKLFNAALRTVDFFSLNSSTKGLLCLSANYIAGKMMIIRALVSGMHLHAVEPNSNPLKALKNSIDFAAMVPMQVKHGLQYPEKFNLLKTLIIGGGLVDNSLKESLLKTTVKAYETFGMTETLSHIALKEISNNQTFFKVLDGIEIGQGYHQELIINVPNLGIYGLKTTDIIDLKGSGQFAWIGRKDFVINSGGIKLHPELIEQKIEHLIQQPFCILGLPDKTLGERVCLIIEGDYFDSSELNKQIKLLVDNYEQPKSVLFAKEFPLTKTGKIKRKELKFLLKKKGPSI